MYTHQQQQTPDASRTPSPKPHRTDWQARAIAAYSREQLDAAALRLKLTTAVHTLTSRTVETGAIFADPLGQVASARVDGVLFRWADSQLVVIRPCAHCGLGTFTSPAVGRVADLGFALGAWQPLHDDCRPFEADAFE
ncbi:MAG: hypothetical protein HGA45_08890 [Chloroflexales bacterium]|nr:hypothetical protein [Chloroflexales bacterium]